MIRVPRTHWASAAAISVLVFGVAFGTYFLVYVNRQEAYYKGRNFRALETVGSQLREQVESLTQLLLTYSPSQSEIENAYQRVIDQAWYSRRLGILRDEIECAKDELETETETETEKEKEKLPGATPSNKVVAEQTERAQWKLKLLQEQNTFLMDRSGILGPQHLVLKERLELLHRVPGFESLKMEILDPALFDSKTPRACELTDVTVQLVNGHVIAKAPGCKSPARCWGARPPMKAEVPIAGLADLTPALKIFDEVLIADDAGSVLDREGALQSGIHDISSLRIERKKDASERKPEPPKPNGSGTSEQAAPQEPTPRERRLPEAASFVDRLPIGGIDYAVFILPIEAPIRDSEKPPRSWYVAGLVNESAFRTQVASVPMPVLNSAVLLLSVCALLWPFMKVGFGSRDEEIRGLTAGTIALCLVAGVGVLVFTFMVVFAGVSRREQRDRTLQTISRDIRKSFRAELAQLLRHLDEQAIEINSTRWPSRSVSIREKKEPESQIPELGEWEKIDDCALLEQVHAAQATAERAAQETRIKLAKADADAPVPQIELPAFEVAFGLDKEGIQRSDIRSYRKDDTSGCFSAIDRQYFRQIQNGEAWKTKLTMTNGGTRPFFMERVRARGRGTISYVISAPHPDARDPRSIVKVIALVGNLRSLADVVLPPGYGFAVVESQTGSTIHHSQNDAWSLVENFFEETDNDQSLRAAIQLHRNEWISANYYGRPHRFYTAPLRETEWSLVLFHREALAQAAQFELLVVSASLLFVYTLLVGIALVAAGWFLPGPQGWTWLWPNPERHRAYYWLIPGLVAVLWSGSSALSVMHGHYVPLVLIAQIAAAVGCVAFALSAPRSVSGGGSRRRWAWLIAAVTIACWLRTLSDDGWSYQRLAWMLPLLALAGLAVAASRARAIAGDWSVARWRTAYLVDAILLIAIVAGLPSVAIFRDALRFESDRFAIFKAQRLGEGLIARESASHAEMLGIDPDRAGLYAAEWRKPPAARLCCRPLPGTESCEGDDIWSLKPGLGSCKQTVDVPTWRSNDDPRPASFSGWLAMQIPAVDADFGSSRFADHAQATDRRWDLGVLENGREGVSVGVGSARVTLPVHQATYCPAPAAKGQRRDASSAFAHLMRSAVVPAPCKPGDMSDRSGRLAIAFACLLVSPLVYASSRRLLALGLPTTPKLRPTDLAAIPWTESPHLLSGPTAWEFPGIADEVEQYASKDVEPVLRVDLRSSEEPALSLRALRRGGRPGLVIVGPLDYSLIEPSRRKALLEFLEELRAYKVCVCAIGEISPLASLSLPGPASTAAPPAAGTASAGADRSRAAEVARWIAVLEWLHVVEWVAPAAGTSWRALADPVEAVLQRECGWRAELTALRDDLRARLLGSKTEERPTPEQLLEMIGVSSEPTYRRVWETCTREERLALIHLASGSYVNTANSHVLRSLERRGLVVRDPVLHVSSRAFARYATRAEDAERLKQWERSAHDSRWVALRIPIVFVVIGLALFLTYSGPDFTSSSLTAIPALVGAIPTLLGVLNSIRGGSRSAPASGG